MQQQKYILRGYTESIPMVETKYCIALTHIFNYLYATICILCLIIMFVMGLVFEYEYNAFIF